MALRVVITMGKLGQNIDQIVIAQTKISSIRNKFHELLCGVRGEIDILMTCRTKA